MRRLTILLMAACALASAAQAEVYAWREGGTTRYSNLAPPWYNASEPSRIRTRVMLNGVLVDDTGLPAEQRDKLRAQRPKAEALNAPRTVPSSATAAAPAATSPLPAFSTEAGAIKPPALPFRGVVNPPDTPTSTAETAKPAAR